MVKPDEEDKICSPVRRGVCCRRNNAAWWALMDVDVGHTFTCAGGQRHHVIGQRFVINELDNCRVLIGLGFQHEAWTRSSLGASGGWQIRMRSTKLGRGRAQDYPEVGRYACVSQAAVGAAVAHGYLRGVTAAVTNQEFIEKSCNHVAEITTRVYDLDRIFVSLLNFTPFST